MPLKPSQGRFPWYNAEGKPFEPCIIGLSGGSASGKTSVSVKIIETLGVPWVVLLSMDSFYKSLSPDQIAAAHRNEYDFDHPNAFDFDALYETLLNLKKGNRVEVPVYDFATHSRLSKTKTIYGANVVIFEGIFALFDPKVRALLDMSIFVDCDADIRLARRLKRDIAERGRDVRGVLSQYARFVKPSFDSNVYPTVAHADVILPRGLDSQAAIDLITRHVLRQLNERGSTFKNYIAALEFKRGEIPSTVTVLDQTPRILSLLTSLRNKDVPRDDFIASSDRLSGLLMEHAASLLPYTDLTVTTPQGLEYHGKASPSMVCGVTIVRSGATMERAVRRVFQDAPIGKLLIQTDPTIGEPQLHYCKLPRDAADRWVFLNDAQCSTGAAGLMAIRVLLDHGVPEDKIIFCSLLSSVQGLQLIHHVFPKVRMVTCQVESDMDPEGRMLNSLGHYGDRYFGT